MLLLPVVILKMVRVISQSTYFLTGRKISPVPASGRSRALELGYSIGGYENFGFSNTSLLLNLALYSR